MTTFNQIINIREDALWRDIVQAYEQKMENLVAKISSFQGRDANSNKDQLLAWSYELIQLTTEIKKILSQRINNGIVLLSKKSESLDLEIRKNLLDSAFVERKTKKKQKIETFKLELENIIIKLNSDNESIQIDYGQAYKEIKIAAFNARLGLDDYTGSFFKFINWILNSIGISIKTDTEIQINNAEKTIYAPNGH
jgi:hypothetical protein